MLHRVKDIVKEILGNLMVRYEGPINWHKWLQTSVRDVGHD